MGKSSSKGLTNFKKILEVLTIIFVSMALFMPQWNKVISPFLSVSIVFYSIITVIYLILAGIGMIGMWASIYGSWDGMPFRDEIIAEVNKKKSIWKKLYGLGVNIVSYAWRIGVIIFFAYTNHMTLSVFNVICLFIYIATALLIRHFFQPKNIIKSESEDLPDDSPEENSEWL